jgi:hypothetical protein
LPALRCQFDPAKARNLPSRPNSVFAFNRGPSLKIEDRVESRKNWTFLCKSEIWRQVQTYPISQAKQFNDKQINPNKVQRVFMFMTT